MSGIKAKQKAIDIERRLRQIDTDMGSKYKELAVKILNSLKDKNKLIKEEEIEDYILSLIQFT